jgi:hypothetical protein
MHVWEPARIGRRFERNAAVSESRQELPETPKDLTTEVTRLVVQARNYQEGMARIQADLQKIQVRLATLSTRRTSSPPRSETKPQ